MSATENQLAFARLVATPEPELDLARGCLHIAAEAHPALDFRPTLGQLDRLADRVARQQEREELEERVAALHRVLYRDYGLRGARRDYYDPRNCFLDDVLARRQGIPITLSVVELEVAWRVGLPLFGIGFPGHFLVGGPGDLVVDPFDQGQRLELTDLQALLRGHGGSLGPSPFPRALLRPATKREILVRILNNLRGIYSSRHQWSDVLWTLELLIILHPSDRELNRDRAILLGRTGQFRAATTGLERYLDENPDGDDAELARRALGVFKGRLN